jgi:hypothetical protein
VLNDHIRKKDSQYDSPQHSDSSLRATKLNGLSVFVLLMTQRTGSSWFSAVLSEQKELYWEPFEILLKRGTERQKFEKFMVACGNAYVSSRVYACGFKSTQQQLSRGFSAGITQYIHENDVTMKFVVLRRSSVARQAISLAVAHESNYWGCAVTKNCQKSHNMSNERKKVVLDSIPKYIQYLETTYESWCDFLRGVEYHELVYEELLDPNVGKARMRELAAFMNVTIIMMRSSNEIDTRQNSSDLFADSMPLLQAKLTAFSNSRFAVTRNRNYTHELLQPTQIINRACRD